MPVIQTFNDEVYRHINSRYAGLTTRLNLQSLASFLQGGGEQQEFNHASYHVREESAREELRSILATRVGEQSVDELIDSLLPSLAELQDIQFSLGIKSGAKLALLLTSGFEDDF